MRAGYKQTEVGEIPEDWEVYRLNEHFRIYAGGDVPWGSLSSFHSDEHPVPIYANSLQHAGLYGYTANARAAANSITITARGTLGRAVYRNHEHMPVGRLLVLEPKGKLDAEYATSAINERVKFPVESTGVPQLTAPQVGTYSIGGPSNQNEQRAIAAALGDGDAAVAGLERLITKKRNLKQAAMQQLLTGQTRLPGFSEAWCDTTLLELCDRRKEFFDDGDWIESEHIGSSNVRLVQTGNIGIGRFEESGLKRYLKEGSFELLRCKEIEPGDLLVCRLADPAGRACVLEDIGEMKMVTSVDVTIVRPSVAKVDRRYLAQLFSTADWFRLVSDRSGGTTHKRISRSALGGLPLRLPQVNEQAAIATVLSDLDAELAALQAQLDKTRLIKQAMMQDLLTGRVRLPFQ